ncbi:MAG: hypothetical protein JXB34_08665 [Bacteroidales bacterium]|nr:hypothetical protein [Bacteroidales bacterium]
MQTFPPPRIYDALGLIMSYYPNHFTEQAKVEIETLLDHCLETLHDDSEKFLSTLIIKALRKMIGTSGIDEHIYLKRYEITQIELFNILIKEFPFVKWGHEIANTLICNKLKDSENAIIVDIGIGQGIQMVHLLQKLNSLPKIKNVTIIGIEPFIDALEATGENFSRLKSQVNYNLHFEPWNIFIENIKEATFAEKLAPFNGEIIINASLALHHIQTLDNRLQVMSVLRSPSPKGIVLVEPNIDHFEPDFNRRFHNCYQHFYHIFQVIDNLNIDQYTKNGLKLFFGREIEDIIGHKNSERYEKHEPAFRWIEKLIHGGFAVQNNFLEKLPEVGSGIDLYFNESGYLGFRYKSETVLSVIYAEPVHIA